MADFNKSHFYQYWLHLLYKLCNIFPVIILTKCRTHVAALFPCTLHFIQNFQRYLKLYKTIMLAIPYIIIFPLSMLTIPPICSISIHYFLSIFILPHCSYFNIYSLYILQIVNYHKIMQVNANNKKQQIICTVLTLLIFVIGIPTLCIYERMLWLWKNTHMIAVGYFLVQVLLFWGTHAVYLAEIIYLNGTRKQE